MNLNVGQITLIELIDQIDRKVVVINKNYQRGGGLWPDSARTYFIDTILEGYPFPKIYLYQVYNEKAKRPIKEIVDGQQRITTINDFLNNKFRLGSASKKYAGMKFEDLSDEIKQKFISYQIETSDILSATRPELLEMFRRINAYTAPLAAAEKRHATFQGDFKWFVVEKADDYSPILEDLNILTQKQLSRMADAEFIADLIVVLEKGVVAKTAKNIDDLYKRYDTGFDNKEKYEAIIDDFFSMLITKLEPIHDTFMMKSYVVHSLFSAYTACKYGLPDDDLIDFVPNEDFEFDFDRINARLCELADAHEAQDDEGMYKEYVESCLSSTTKGPQRKNRFSILKDVFLGR